VQQNIRLIIQDVEEIEVPEKSASLKTPEQETYVVVLQVKETSQWTCHMEGCSLPYHSLQNCQVFRKLSLKQRMDKIGLLLEVKGHCAEGRFSFSEGVGVGVVWGLRIYNELW